MTIGQKIQQYRKRLGLSQSELAEKIAVSRQTVSKWELDETLPDTGNILKLCTLFELQTEQLLYNDCPLQESAHTVSRPLQDTRRYFRAGICFLIAGVLIIGTLVTLLQIVPARMKVEQSVSTEDLQGLDAELETSETRTVYSYVPVTGFIPFLNTYYLHWLLAVGGGCIVAGLYCSFLYKRKTVKAKRKHKD